MKNYSQRKLDILVNGAPWIIITMILLANWTSWFTVGLFSVSAVWFSFMMVFEPYEHEYPTRVTYKTRQRVYSFKGKMFFIPENPLWGVPAGTTNTITSDFFLLVAKHNIVLAWFSRTRLGGFVLVRSNRHYLANVIAALMGYQILFFNTKTEYYPASTKAPDEMRFMIKEFTTQLRYGLPNSNLALEFWREYMESRLYSVATNYITSQQVIEEFQRNDVTG